jgi:hypothetical protein
MRDQTNNARPEILEGLDYEQQYMQNSARSTARRRVELKNRGDAWLLRFLPAKVGPGQRYYARIATHWLNRKPSQCPRHTEPDFGGDPNAYCPVCELSDDLNADRNEKVSKFGWDIRAGAQWHTYCAVFEKLMSGQDPVAQPINEILQPYEFNHYKSTWEEFMSFLRQGARRTPWSILDLEQGNDFWVTKTSKGLRLDKQDSAPIFDLNDPNYQAWVDKLLKNIKEPNAKMPTAQQMEDFADKAREEAAKIGRPGGATVTEGRRTGGGDEEYLPPRQARSYAQDAPVDEAPPARPAARPAPAPAQAARPAARPAAAAAPAPARRSAAPPPQEDPEPLAEAPQDEQPTEEYQIGDVPVDEAPVDEAPQEEPAPAPAPAPRPAARPAAAPVARPAARPAAVAAAAPVAAASRPSPMTPARAAAAAGTRPAAAPARPAAAPARPSTGATIAQESIDEEEMIPEEKSDPAPAEPLAEAGTDDGGEAPPAVAQTGQKGTLGSNIKNRIAAVGAKR